MENPATSPLRATAPGRGIVAAACLAVVLTLGACAPSQVILDNPKDGTTAELRVAQPLRFRISNPDIQSGTWAQENARLTAVKPAVAAPAANSGATQTVQYFDFLAAAPGQEKLSFVYHRKSGEPQPGDTMTVLVNVKQG